MCEREGPTLGTEAGSPADPSQDCHHRKCSENRKSLIFLDFNLINEFSDLMAGQDSYVCTYGVRLYKSRKQIDRSGNKGFQVFRIFLNYNYLMDRLFVARFDIRNLVVQSTNIVFPFFSSNSSRSVLFSS